VGAQDGHIQLTMDGNIIGDVGGLENAVHLVDFVRMGALSLKAGASGTMYFDEFGSGRAIEPRGLVINEVDYDQIGTDDHEFVEIYNPSFAPMTLDGVRLELFNGSGNAIYRDIDLGGQILGGGQYLVVADPLVSVAPSAIVINFAASTDNIQNGAPDGILLYDAGKCRALDALSYEGPMTAVTEPHCATSVSLVEGTALAASVADSNSQGGSLSRLPNGSDTDDAASDWSFSSTPTPGTANAP